MRFRIFIITFLFTFCVFFIIGINNIHAYDSRAGSSFYIELPDGSTEELKGIQLVAIGHDHQDPPGFYYFSACEYDYEVDDSDPNYEQAIGSQCYTKSSCRFLGHFMPYMPGHYNSNLSLYVRGDYWDANVPTGDPKDHPGVTVERCSRDKGMYDFLVTSHVYFYGMTFTERFPWFPYEDRNPRGTDHAYWVGEIDSYCTGDNCPGVPWVSTIGYDFKGGPYLLKDICCEPDSMIWYGRDDRPSWAGSDIAEVINESHSGNLHNQWHLNMSWTLKIAEQLPTVTISGPGDCYRTGTFTVQAEDPDFNSIKEVELVLKDGGTPYIYSFNLENGNFSEPSGSPFEIETPSIPIQSASVTVDLTVTNLEELGYHQYKTISYRARAKGSEEWGEWSNWQQFNEEWYYPSPSISASPDYGNQTIDVTFADNGSKANECLWSVTSGSNNATINSEWLNIRSDRSLPAKGTGQCSGSYSFSPAYTDNYTFSFSGEGGLCGTDTTVNTGSVYEAANAWLMTGWGDVYVYGGITSSDPMEMMEITDNRFSIPTINDWAYFSTYIISKSDSGGSFPTTEGDGDGKSKRGFQLDSYDDMNRDKVGDSSVYNYIKDLSEENECTTENCRVITGMPASCTGQKVYFIDSDLQIDSNFNVISSSDACVFVVKENVNVAPNVRRLDAFFLVDGTFTSQSSDRRLEIEGGVISNNASFIRAIDNSYLNPSEVISYDPKYLDLLREYLGVDYPSNVRELGYSSSL